MRSAASLQCQAATIRLSRATFTRQPAKTGLTSLDSGKGHAAHWPLADIDDRFSELVGGHQGTCQSRVTGPVNAAVYDRSEHIAEAREISSFECAVCGATIENWNSAWVPRYRFIARPARDAE